MGISNWFKSEATKLREEVECAQYSLELKAMEANSALFDDLLGNLVHPLEPFFDPEFGDFFLPLNVDRKRIGDEPPIFTSEQQLALIRAQSRRLVSHNEFAINAVENRVSHIVGSGGIYTAAAKPEQVVSDDDVAAVQASVDGFIDFNDWNHWEQELVRRGDRDGEWFLRLFRQLASPTIVRVIEPGQVRQPDGKVPAPVTRVNGNGRAPVSLATFGIQTTPMDVLQIVAYWIDGRPVDAERVVHQKLNVDMNVKRGVPTLFPVRKNLERAEKLLRNMSTVAAIQAAIAMIRRHAAPKGSVETFADEKAAAKTSNPLTGKDIRLRGIQQPRIIDAPVGQDYEFPAAGVRAEAYVEVLQAELRAVAARLIMPEFMFTSDASNANLASTLISESPTIRNFLRLQAFYKRPFKRIMWTAVRDDVMTGRLRVRPEVLDQIEIQVEFPQLEVIDTKSQTERRQVLSMNGILSNTTWAVQEGLDPDEEQRNRQSELDMDTGAAPLPMPGEDDDGPDEEPPRTEGGPPGPAPPILPQEPIEDTRVQEQVPDGPPSSGQLMLPLPPAPPVPNVNVNVTIPERQTTVEVDAKTTLEAGAVQAPVDARVTIEPGAVEVPVQVDAQTTIEEGAIQAETNVEVKGGDKHIDVTRNRAGNITGADVTQVDGEDDGGDDT